MVSPAAQAPELEEERLRIEEAKAGNLDAMRPIFESYSGPLYQAVILPRVGDAAAAEDVLRDTLATAIQKLDRFTWTGKSIFGWLRQIAVNKSYDLHRKRKRGYRLVEAMTHEAETSAAGGDRPDVQLIARQEQEMHRKRIAATLETLNPRYRRAIELRLIEEEPREACAKELDVTVSTFDVVFFRALKAFRKNFGEPVS